MGADMPPSARPPTNYPVALSRALPLVTVLLSDLEGPSQRQRLVLREGRLPDWLRDHASVLGPSFDCVVAAMGKARLGSQTHIQSVVVYPAQPHAPETAYVYVTEREAGGRATRDAAPVHVVRCAKLPAMVRFVEVPPPPPGARPSLRVL